MFLIAFTILELNLFFNEGTFVVEKTIIKLNIIPKNYSTVNKSTNIFYNMYKQIGKSL